MMMLMMVNVKWNICETLCRYVCVCSAVTGVWDGKPSRSKVEHSTLSFLSFCSDLFISARCLLLLLLLLKRNTNSFNGNSLWNQIQIRKTNVAWQGPANGRLSQDHVGPITSSPALTWVHPHAIHSGQATRLTRRAFSRPFDLIDTYIQIIGWFAVSDYSSMRSIKVVS